MSDLPLGEGQSSYNLKEDITNRKVDVTFGQLIEMVPKLKHQWKKLANRMDNEPKKGSIKVMSMDEAPKFFPIVDVWHKRKVLGKGYAISEA